MPRRGESFPPFLLSRIGLTFLCQFSPTLTQSFASAHAKHCLSQLSEGKITLDEYNRKKADLEKQISNCDVKLADKQQKLEQKMKELQDIKDKVNFYDVAYVRFDVPEIKVKPPKITERPPRFGNIDELDEGSERSHQRAIP